MGGLRKSLTLHIKEGCWEEVRPEPGLKDEQSWPGQDLTGEVAVVGSPEVRRLKNPSLP